MAPKLFLTGTTGYIGGDSLFVITKKHPDWDITCLVRNSDKGAKVAQQYAHVRLVYGDLDAIDLIEEEASRADIVYHFANCDHEASARAIARGLARRTKDDPGFWIHTCGTAILTAETSDKQMYGEQLSKVYDDWDGIGELISLPHDAPHRNVDEIVLAASASSPNIKTAIVCPPTIYGVGRGPDNQRSIQVYLATQFFLKTQRSIKIGKGENVWHQVHVHDLSELYLLLGEAAAAGGPPATWNEQGYYLAENGEFKWGDVLQEVTTIAHKQALLPSAECISVAPDEIANNPQLGKRYLSIGTNSRGVAVRARKLLDWQPKGKSLKDEIPAIVDSEAKLLGLLSGHAAKVEAEVQE